MQSRFNIKDKHVAYIRSILSDNVKAGYVGKELAIIHGDGTIFSSNNNETTKRRDKDGWHDVVNARFGSDHHREYNSGFDENEAIAIAKFRATYRKGDVLPKTPEEIIEAFYRQVEGDMRVQMSVPDTLKTNVFRVDEGSSENMPEMKASVKETEFIPDETPKHVSESEEAVKSEPKKGGRPPKNTK